MTMLFEQDHQMTIKWSLLTSFNSVLTSDRLMLVFEIVNFRVIKIFGRSIFGENIYPKFLSRIIRNYRFVETFYCVLLNAS